MFEKYAAASYHIYKAGDIILNKFKWPKKPKPYACSLWYWQNGSLLAQKYKTRNKPYYLKYVQQKISYKYTIFKIQHYNKLLITLSLTE